MAIPIREPFLAYVLVHAQMLRRRRVTAPAAAECVGRAKTNSHFGASQTSISAQAVHRFRRKPNTDFG